MPKAANRSVKDGQSHQTNYYRPGTAKRYSGKAMTKRGRRIPSRHGMRTTRRNIP